jgi:hypothetical protein
MRSLRISDGLEHLKRKNSDEGVYGLLTLHWTGLHQQVSIVVGDFSATSLMEGTYGTREARRARNLASRDERSTGTSCFIVL